MPKILMFVSVHRRGITSQLVGQTTTLAGRGRVTLFAVSGEGEQHAGVAARLADAGVQLTRLPGLDSRRHFQTRVRSIGALAGSIQPDVVHVHTNWQLALVWTARRAFNLKYKILYTIHGYRHNSRIRAAVARPIIGYSLRLLADRVIVPSGFLQRQFARLGPKGVMMFLGVDQAFLEHDWAPPVFEGTRSMVFAGEFRHGKNQDMLIHAVDDYIRRSGDDDLELHLPGDGGTRPACQALSRRLGIDRVVRFPGFLDRAAMLQLYRRCQFALVPTNVETFGFCVAEPFALGRVVITRPVGVATDVVRDGETGFLFNGRTDLAEKLLRILPDATLCATVAAQAYRQRSVFDWDRISASYETLIEEMTAVTAVTSGHANTSHP